MSPKTVHRQTKHAVHERISGKRGDTVENKILLALTPKDRSAVMAQLEAVDLPTHTVLHEPERPIQFVYFLNDGLASILTIMPGGKSVEVGLAGRDGFVGASLLAGLRSSPTRVVMQVGGHGFRMKAHDVKNTLHECPGLEKGLLHHAQELTMQATQIAACNRLHEVSQRLARWLLMSQDRLGGRLVPLTQQYLAHMLGTRRASVTVAARKLQKSSVISYSRGVVTVKDRRKLEGASCACYRILRRQAQLWQREAKSAARQDHSSVSASKNNGI
jgi:CRP-like cAMP-binding protein